MHEASLAVGAEGTVSKKASSLYLPGRRVSWWTKTKHRRSGVFPVVGWRPSTPFRPGGLIVAEDSHVVGVASLVMPEVERAALVELLLRYGRSHPTGAVTIPEDCLAATVRFTSRTPTLGQLREATIVAVHPVNQPSAADPNVAHQSRPQMTLHRLKAVRPGQVIKATTVIISPERSFAAIWAAVMECYGSSDHVRG
jgi:ATP-dependent DNA ligase